MAQKRKKVQSKHLNTAANLYRDKRREGIRAAVTVAAGVALFAVTYILVSNGTMSLASSASFLVWLFFAILAIVVYLATNRWSRASGEYRRYINGHGISDTEIKEFMKTHR